MKWRLFVAMLTLVFWIVPFVEANPPGDSKADFPRAHDPRLIVELFAASPDIVHPIGVAFDRKGRMLVIESHTHFPPK